MCGIIGIVSHSPVAERLVDGLSRMEYRGYDSAGVCTIDHGALIRRRAQGKLVNLVRELEQQPAPGTVGIAHTRWATHGAPTTSNAHPHATGEVALVHNGIIENYKPLRDELLADGRRLESETDSEVVAHLISREVENGASPQEAVATVLPQLRGAFALAILFRTHPELLIGARLGSPLVIGYGEPGEDEEVFLGSDALALASLTQRIAYLEEGDWVVVTRRGRNHPRCRGRNRRTRDHRLGRIGRGGREGELPPLHAEGDLRAADRGCANPEVLLAPGRRRGGAAAV